MEMNLLALKEPRGFIRVLQAFFGVFAFSITAGYSTTAEILIDCKEFKAPVNVTFGYPFRMAYFPFDVPKNCSTVKPEIHTVILPYNLSSNPEFFVACGVLSFMLCSAFVAVYVLRSALYQANQTIPIIDLALTALFTIFWFSGSCAWAQGVSDVKYYMDPDLIIERIPVCADLSANCTPNKGGDYSTLNISVLLGFTNVMLWAAGAWFVYKDTVLHRQQQLPPGAPGSQYPPVGANYPPQSPTQPMQGQFQQPQY